MSDFNAELFENISLSDISPVYSWIWNSVITRDIIDAQLDEMYAQGIRAAYILPEPKDFRPDSMVTHMSPEYLSDEFFELIKYTVERANMLHISMWLYDEGGWPSGNACGAIVKKFPDAVQKCIAVKTVMLKTGDVIEKDNCIAAFTKEYEKLDLPYKAEKECEIDVYYIKQSDSIFAHIIDKRVMNEFVESTYEGYKKNLGNCFKNISAIFTDEPLIEYPYYIGDVAEFERIYGHSFDDNVYVLFTDTPKGIQKKFKADYIEYCSKVFEERFVKLLSDWCKQNNILFTGHFDGDNVFVGNGFKRQVGNIMSHLRYMDIPGIDVILRQIFPDNKSNNFYPRFASSAAHQTGRNLAVSETFAVYGNGVTFEQMRYVCNYLFVRGINIINFMSVTSGRDRCLSSQCRPHYTADMPEYEFRKVFNDYISRMMYLCRLGKIECDVALYIPLRDIWAGENVESDFWQTGKSLEEKQVYFDVIDDDFILNNEIKYKSIFIPKTATVRDKVKEKLENCGAKIYYSTDEAESLVKCDNPNVRVMKRVSDSETLYILFNESDKEIAAKIDFNEPEKGYILNCYDASIKKLTNKKIRLFSGEAAAVIFTKDKLKVDTDVRPRLYKVLNEFEVTPIYKVEFVNQKLCKKTKDIIIDESFSGSACYSVQFEYDGESDILIDLGNVYYYAEIKINGQTVNKLVMPPYTAVISANLLNKKNYLEIIVSNTSANAYVYADYSNVPSNVIGPYHERTLAFEKESLDFGITEVKLFIAK